MEWRKIIKKLPKWTEKYRYVGLVLLIGVFLMLIPTGTKQSKTVIKAQAQEAPSDEEMLAELLSMVDGAGAVRVMLTESSGAQTIYQTTEEYSENDGHITSSTDTILITDADRGENGLIVQVNPPVYLGALIVCQGADNPRVRLAIVEAVSRITGLGTNKISVVKMK